MVQEITISEARSRLSAIAKQLADSPEDGAVIVTQRGKPALALMSSELYEGLMETLEIMSDPDLMAGIRQGLKDGEEGRTLNTQELEEQLGL